VVVASSQRVALMREFEVEAQLNVHHLIAELYDGVDWVLVDGFKQADLQKIEVHRLAAGQPVLYAEDDFIVAIATDTPELFEGKTLRPIMDVDSADAVAQWLVDHGERFEYRMENHVKI
jgi:molybdopterin-guanine dinucleotide biosynthesis protein B